MKTSSFHVATFGAALKILWFAGLLLLSILILSNNFSNWQSSYQSLGVPSATWPGHDSRNIQMAFACQDQVQTDDFEKCITNANQVRAVHPQANVPSFNYPPIWIYVYGFLAGDSTEGAYIRFWWINAIATLATISLLSWRFAPWLLPLFLFSPLSLLLIERGNIEGLAFAALFLPLFLGSPVVSGAAIAFAGGLKVFPAIAAAPLLVSLGRRTQMQLMLGLAAASPILIWALLNLGQVFHGTSSGFKYAYGIPTLKHDDFFRDKPLAMGMAVAVYLGLVCLMIRASFRNQRFQTDIQKLANSVGTTGCHIAMASLSIFCATHLLFANWDYRLVFLVPAACIAARLRGTFGLATFSLMIVLFLVPWAPNGWRWANFYTHILALFTWPFLACLIREQVRLTKSA